MSNSKRFFLTVSVVTLAATVFLGGNAFAKSSYLSSFNSTYGTSGTALDDCSLCHGPSFFPLTSFGNDWSGNSKNFAAIEGLDSDGDGFVNIDEITALTLPQDASSFPEVVGPVCTDNDGDGFALEGGDCGPVDCDDSNAAVNPDASEDCTDGIDNDCNGLVDATDPQAQSCPPVCTDADNDGYSIEGGECGPVDCDDTKATVNPGASESCTDGLDNDCDNLVDVEDPDALDCPVVEPPQPTCTDADSDTFFAEGGDCGPADCDDTDPLTFPGNVEDCTDAIDNNCDGLIDAADPNAEFCPPTCTDEDLDGYALEGGECGPVDCDDTNADIHPAAEENCTDGIDNDCDNKIDAADTDAVDCPIVCTDADGDGYAIEGGECGEIDPDDTDADVFPGSDNPVDIPVEPIDGAALYADDCAACHGELASSEVAGSSASQIQAAVDGNKGGMGFLNFLTAPEVQAISEVLAGSAGDNGDAQVPVERIQKQIARLEARLARAENRLAARIERGGDVSNLELQIEAIKADIASLQAALAN